MVSIVIEELIQLIISTQFSAFDFIRNITKSHATIRLLLILVQGSIITVIIYDDGINFKDVVLPFQDSLFHYFRNLRLHLVYSHRIY